MILKYNTIENGYNERRSGLIKKENPEKYNIEHYREYRRLYNREYYKKNDKYREYIRKYQKVYQKEHRNTEEYKEYHRKWQRDYYYSKKMGISVSEYRKLKNDQGTTLEQNKKQPIQLTINF